MNTAELVRLSLQRIGAHPLRSTLTILGIVIGVAAVVAVVAVGQGSSSRITNSISALGTNLLTVSAGRQFNGFVQGAAGSATTLTSDDAAAIAELDGISAVAPSATSNQVVSFEDQNVTTSIVGTTPTYMDIRDYEVWQGRFLSEVSSENRLRIAVIGSDTAESLGLDASDVGAVVRVGGIPFTVAGILQPKGGIGSDDAVLIPIETLQRQFASQDTLDSISVSVADGESTDLASARITSLLRTRHGLSADESADFSIASQDQLLEVASNVSSTLTVLLVAIGSISLLVGGIGIMNIMLVSVRERTQEIGVRKAIGARRRDILAQFLVEAVVLSMLGGLLGVVFGAVASLVIGQLAGWGFVFSLPTVLIALSFSALVGIAFGVWPAQQAAALDPAEALRYE